MNSDKVVVRRLPVKSIRPNGATSVQVGAVSTTALSDSVYYLRVQVTQLPDSQIVEQMACFGNISIPLPAMTDDDEVALAICRMTPDELKLHLRQARYAMNKEESDLLKELDDEGKRLALTRFWQQHDPDPSTLKNEFWEEYMERVRLADSRFKNRSEPGWLSDRGRILIKFGNPDDIERNPLSTDAKPFEEWHYYRERGLRFIFIDEEGFNRYRLIYSNVEDEVSDPNWQTLINYQ